MDVGVGENEPDEDSILIFHPILRAFLKVPLVPLFELDSLHSNLLHREIL